MLEFKIFCKLSLINIIPFVFKFLPAVDTFKKKQNEIKNFIGKDSISGFRYLGTKEEQKLLNYNYTTNAFTIFISSIISFACVVIYFFGLKIPRPFDCVFYDKFISLCSYLGLLPTIFAIILLLRMVQHYFKVLKYLDSQT